MLRDAGALATAGYSITVAAVGGTVISDDKALMIAIGAGLIGGFVSAVLGTAPGDRIDWRKGLAQVIAAGFVVPVVVWYLMIHKVDEPLTLFPVAAVSGICALFAWPVYALVAGGLGKIKPTEAADWLRNVIKAFTGGGK